MHDDPTIEIPAISDFPTQKLLRAPRPVPSLMAQRKALREQSESMLAWEPVVLFLAALVGYGMLGCFLASHVNEVLYVLFVEWQLGR